MATFHRDLAAPTRTPERTLIKPLPGLDIKAKYHSARTGGDFFYAMTIGSRMVFLLTDISGKRLEAHSIAADVQDAFRTEAQEVFSSPAANESEGIVKLLHEVNGALISASRGIRNAPTFIGCYNATLAILTYINAGGPPPLFRDSDGTRTLDTGGVPLGLFSHMTHEPCVQVFEPAARLLIVTKGVIDSGRGKNEFGVARLQKLLQESKANSASEICDVTLQAAHRFWKRPWFLRFRKSEPIEDLTAVALVRT